MKVLASVLLTMLVWGNLASAALPQSAQGGAQELQRITSWMAQLNEAYPELEVETRLQDLTSAEDRAALEYELELLTGAMAGAWQLPDNSLTILACGNPVCDGGGGGGKCSMCQEER